MMDVIKNGLRQNLIFKGALHLSFVDKKVNDYDKVVINVNKNKEEGKTWVDFIVIYGMLGDSWENFRIGGNIDSSVRGHQDIEKWLEMSMKELDWQGSISCLNKDALILNIFNFINGVSDVILTSDTSSKIEYEDGFVIKTFYPWPEEDNDDQEEEEDTEEVVEEVVEEVIEKEITEEEGEEEYTGINKPLNPNDVVQFLDYKLTKIEDGGLGCKSPFFIFNYENEEVYSKIELLIQKDEDGNPHVTKADIYQHGYGSKDKTKAISTPEDLEDFSVRKEEFEIRIMKAARIGSVTTEAFYADRLKQDLSTLIKKLLEGMEWKESLQSPTTNVDADEDEY